MFGPFLSMLDAGIVNVGLPSVSREFQVPLGDVQWVSSVYFLAISALLPVLGNLADQVGRRLIFTFGFFVLALFTLTCGWAPNLPVLILFRVFQAVGGAMIIANGMALVTENYPPAQRGRNLGILATMGALGSILGPVLGGLIIGTWGWRSVFIATAVVGFAGFATTLVTIPRDARKPHTAFRMDALGSLLLTVTILALGIGISSLNTPQGLAGYGGVAGVSFVVALVVFLLWERRASHPILKVELFGNARFLSSWILSFGGFMTLMAPAVLVPFYFQSVAGLDPGTSGLAMLSFPAAMALVSPWSGRASDRWGSERLATLGLALGALGLFGLALVGPGTPVWGFIALYGGLGVAMGTFQSPNNSALLGAAPKALLGSATAFTQLARNLGSAVGIAVAGALFGLFHGASATIEAAAFYRASSWIFGGFGAVAALAALFSLTRKRWVRHD
jgi:EmrB/QacA subfamily drug resistance transporter